MIVLLQEARLNRGYSLREAARRINISRETLVRAEAGIRISPYKAKLIADFYGFKVTDIWPVVPQVA